LLREKEISKVIVFCKSKKIADDVFKTVVENFGAENCRLVHGNKNLQTRINSMNAFRTESIRILITTDVASRGIDVQNVSHVINFDVPLVYEDYIHRIGRTGRAFLSGASFTFCTEGEEWHLEKIEKLIKQKIPVEQIPKDVVVEKTSFEEKQLIAMELDKQKRKDNPEFKGAFHQKKSKQEYAGKK
jgi:ATP-dependent RNA helicase RhlE